jgi:outer membrane protein assembly factor BamC
LAFSLGGCGLFGGQKDGAPIKVREALEVPPDLARPAGEDVTSGVPAGGAAAYSDYAAKAKEAPVAAPAQPAPAAPAAVGVRLERDGALRWLVVDDAPERVWAMAREYYLRNNIKLVVDNARAGLLETDWLDRPVEFSNLLGKVIASFSSTGLRDKYRVRVEPGRVAGTSEVVVSHQGLEEVVAGGAGAGETSTRWQPRASDPAAEADMLAKLMVQLGVDAQQAKTQLAATAAERARLVTGGLLLPQEELDAAWRRVGQALDRSGVAIEDRDRSAGLYYIRFVDPGARKTVRFSWLPSNVTVGDDNETTGGRFQVALKTQVEGVTLSVRNVKGDLDDSKTAERLLNLLLQQLR